MDSEKDEKKTAAAAVDAVAVKDREEESEAVEAVEEKAEGKVEEQASEKEAEVAEGADAAEAEGDELVWEEEPEREVRSAGSGVLPGAAGLVAAGLGLASVTGSWMGTILSQRAQLVGQIHASGKAAAQQVQDLYVSPWHTVAGVNGIFALLAVVIGVVVLLTTSKAMSIARHPAWVQVLAWGGIVLGAIGMVIALGMYFDIFASVPTVPATAGAGAGAGAGG